MILKRLVTLTDAAIAQNAQYIESRIRGIGIVGAIFFPLYYVVWHNLFPQPYENLSLRLIGSALFLLLVFTNYWPQPLTRYKSIYWYFAILYGLPFFFTYMLLMNAASTVWLMSTLVAVFLMMLLLSWYNLIIQFILGSALAWLAFYLTSDHPQVTTEYWNYLPIYFFAIAAGGLLNFNAGMVRQEKLRAMLTVASNIAHELRTPLLGIKSGAAGLRNYFPALLHAYRVAQDNGLAVKPIRLAHLEAMQSTLDKIENEAIQSNVMIDILLMNTGVNGFKPELLTTCSMRQCVESALARYPFPSDKEKKLIVWAPESDFTFRGIELLMVHVLFNLMKNSIYQIAKAGKGEITIQINRSPQGNRLIFRDTASGIPAEVLPHIFTRFYSWMPDDNDALGAGIGLAFCRSVMHSFGGTITCQSQLGQYAEFTLTFPADIPA